MRLLLSQGADAADGPTLDEGSATWEALRHCDRDSLEALARGADRSLRDDVFDGTPAGWAHAGGHADLANRLAKPL